MEWERSSFEMSMQSEQGREVNQRILITGCSGGGKSTLLAALGQRGFATVLEPGRRIIAEENTTSGSAVPWMDAEAFARRAIDMARADLASVVSMPGPVFFDRGLIDAAVGLESVMGRSVAETLGPKRHYAQTVLLAPPWPEIFCQDVDRRHDMDAAIAEYQRLAEVIPALGYTTCLLPKISVQDRADFVLDQLELR